jgi:hypothetical protein
LRGKIKLAGAAKRPPFFYEAIKSEDPAKNQEFFFVIPAEAGIQERIGYRIRSGITNRPK